MVNLMKMFAVMGTTQDEHLLRKAERVANDRDGACADLRSRMQKNQVYCKQSMANTKKTGEVIASNLGVVEANVADSNDATKELQILQRNQAALEKLAAQHRDLWSTAIREWLDEADGVDPDNDDDNPDTFALAKLVADFIAKGEPSLPVHSTAIITYHPQAPLSETAKVAFATGNVGLTNGQSLRRAAKKKPPTVEAIWEVIESGESHVMNPYNHPEVAKEAVSVVPLRQTNRHVFGALVSGPAAVPDEFIEQFGRTAGQMFERIGKLEIVWRIVSIAQQFVEQQCVAANKLVYVKFVKSGRPTVSGNEWDWQPLEYTHPMNDKRFECPLAWKGGEPIGLFSVECGTFTPMDEQLIVLLHTIGPLLKDCVAAVEKMNLGDKPPCFTPQEMMKEYERCAEHIGASLSLEMSRCLKNSLTFYSAIVEAGIYCKKVEDDDTKRLMQALLTVAGMPCDDWKAVRNSLKSARTLTDTLSDVLHPRSMGELASDALGGGFVGSMVGSMVGVASSVVSTTTKVATKVATDAVNESVNVAKKAVGGSGGKKESKKSKKKKKGDDRFAKAEAYVKNVDLNALAAKSTVPIQIVIKWWKIARLTFNVTIAVGAPKDESIDPIAEKIFQTIDSNGNGSLSTDELITYMLKEYGAERALKLITLIDSNNDGKVSHEEWHAAVKNGDFHFEAAADGEFTANGHGTGSPKFKLLSRHLTRKNLPTSSGPLPPVVAPGAKGKSVAPIS